MYTFSRGEEEDAFVTKSICDLTSAIFEVQTAEPSAAISPELWDNILCSLSSWIENIEESTSTGLPIDQKEMFVVCS